MTFEQTTPEEHQTSILHQLHSGHAPPRTVYGLPESNVGFRLMRKGGWDSEKGLGVEGTGRKYPIPTVFKRNRRGLGGGAAESARVTHYPHLMRKEVVRPANGEAASVRRRGRNLRRDRASARRRAACRRRRRSGRPLFDVVQIQPRRSTVNPSGMPGSTTQNSRRPDSVPSRPMSKAWISCFWPPSATGGIRDVEDPAVGREREAVRLLEVRHPAASRRCRGRGGRRSGDRAAGRAAIPVSAFRARSTGR